MKTVSQLQPDHKSFFRQLYDYSIQINPACEIFSDNWTDKWLYKIIKKIDEIWYQRKLIEFLKRMYAKVECEFVSDSLHIAAFVSDDDSTDGVVGLYVNKDLFAVLFKDGDTSYHAGGLVNLDNLGCLLHILLHESVHLLLSLCKKVNYRNKKEHHNQLFRRLIRTMFGHQSHKHGLIRGLNPTMDVSELCKYLHVDAEVYIFLPSERRLAKGRVEKITYRHNEINYVHLNLGHTKVRGSPGLIQPVT